MRDDTPEIETCSFVQDYLLIQHTERAFPTLSLLFPQD